MTKMTTADENFSLLFEASPIGIVVINDEFIIKDINHSALEILSVGKEIALGQRFGNGFNCISRFDNPQGCGCGSKCGFCELNSAVKKAKICDEPTTHIECTKVFLQGKVEVRFWFNASIVPISLKGKRHIVIYLQDITANKKNEIAFKQSRDLCLHLLDNFPTLMWKVDEEGNCEYVNKSWMKFTGFAFDKALDQGWMNSVHPEDRQQCMKIFYDSANHKKNFNIEYRMRRYDGEYRYCVSRGKPYYNPLGMYAGYTGVVHDITDIRLAREAAKKYYVLSENSRDIILFIDDEGKIVEANRAAIEAYGYSREELFSKRIFDLRGNIEVTWEQLEQVYQNDAYFETTHICKDGTFFPVEVNSQVTTVCGKRLLVNIIRDISERKKTEQELHSAKEEAEAANRAKSEFLANMSHEIRTPLNGIVGMIDLTLLSSLSAEQKENLETAKTCAYTLFKVINDILDFSKMEANKLVLENVDFNFKELIEDTVKTHVPKARTKNIELNYSLSTSIPKLLTGDPHRIKQVLNNLLDNAIKFTESGEVTLAVKCDFNEINAIGLKFSVKDTGIGITPEDQANLFKIFSQVDSSVTRKFGGTGLGLAISKQLVEMMGGEIWVESEKEKGSCFSFTLKLMCCDALQEVPQRERIIRKKQSPLDVLLVEDDKINSTVLSLMLKEKGHCVDIAYNGAEALSLYSQQQYDVILMDIHMPLMDGIEATQRIREIEKESKHTPIIALTAYALKGDREKFLSCGMDEYIPKPVMMEELYVTIDQVVSNNNVTHYHTLTEMDGMSEVSISATGELRYGKISSLMQDAPPLRVKDITQDITKLLIAGGEGNLVAIEHIAHRIKQKCENMDEELKTISFKIELAARRGDLSEAAEKIQELERELRVFEKTYNGGYEE